MTMGISIDKTKNNLPEYKLHGLIGIIFSIITFLTAIYFKQHILLSSILVPVSLLSGFYFIGYMIDGKKKDGFKWIVILVAIIIVLIMVSLIIK